MNSAELLLRCLVNEGVEIIYGVPGEETLELMNALLDSEIRFITCRHEQGAAFMADVQGRITGRAGGCLSTLGPGATNLMTGVADANMDHAPLVAITGQAGLDRLHKESHQHIDLVSAFRPLTKWSTLVGLPRIIPEVVRKAFKVAQAEKPGATHLDFPEDVAAMEAAGEPLPPEEPEPAQPPEKALRKAAKIIADARAPLVLAGAGVGRCRCATALTEFAERLNIPVANTFMGKGAIPHTSEQSLLTVGLQARDYVMAGFDRADVIIAVGYDVVEYSPARWNPDGDKIIVHIDASSAEVDASYGPAVEVVGDISTALQALTEMVPPKDTCVVCHLRPIILRELAEGSEDTGFPLKPQRIIAELHRVFGDEDLLISDVGAHKLWIARMFPTMRPNTCIISNGLAAMGIALPGAIAAKLMRPYQRVVAACGDGGVLMNIQELETAVRLRTPFVTLVFNDGGYGVIAWKQILKYGRPAFVEFGNPDFVKLAESFGCAGYRVEAADELGPILTEALQQDVPAVIDCPVDYSENFRLTEKLGQITVKV